ncbi:S-M checkpoint control protein rad4 [Trichoderma lentiforme]|uniref:S-M checkpoint control protein rad4 n=1 Tax=Trichoderma lentiforme TaxID=1567552 RepID=A0A9P4X4J8_9HYPO|nr:S-M checkpoint control protein rad4 [Trichoderma lentiforme]
MASHSSEDEGYGFDPSVPFKGVIVCCTSIPPDQRTDIAQKVAELGGLHKYDLTPDVTHLVVGDYDTPKYRHVARERVDIKAMDAAWINAVNELWKNDEEFDFVALENSYQLKALETSGVEPSSQEETSPAARGSLLICLTGFGDTRDQIAEMIMQNGGRYTGDLTRRCSHLIVSKPEGKKFTAAKSWGVHTVTLDWLEQTVARGMILEETKFDPLLPPEEQGVGAWVKKDPKRSALGKRARSAVLNGGPDEGMRKLRKTASMKLSSQRNDLWGDILGRSASREYSFAHENPPGAPTTGPDPAAASVDAPIPISEVPTQPGYSLQEDQGVFANCVFVVHGFPQQRATILEQTIATLGGNIVSSLQSPAMLSQPTDPEHYRFLIVPQTSQPDTHPKVPNEHIHIITEFYIENCLHNKRFFNPNEQVLGRPFPLFPIPAFSSITVCSAAFTGIELNQVARSVAQLGGKYEESFRRSTNVLVCKSLMSMRREKLKCALDWGVPVVSADWLWECISSGSLVPIEDFVYPEIKKRRVKRDPFVNDEDDAAPERPLRKAPEAKPAAKPPKQSVDTTAFDKDLPGKSRAKQTLESITSADFLTARTHPVNTVWTADTPPLTELSSAALNVSPKLPAAKTPLARIISAPAKLPQPQEQSVPAPSHPTSASEPRELSAPQPKQSPEPAPEATKQAPPEAPTEQEPSADQVEKQRQLAAAAELRQGLTSALSNLIPPLTSTSLSNSNSVPHQQSGPRALGRRRHKILGRAISNASNASSAASIDSAALPPRALQDEDVDEERLQRQSPPATQLEYRDPEAMETKAMLMSRMTGAVEAAPPEILGRTRSSRRK